MGTSPLHLALSCICLCQHAISVASKGGVFVLVRDASAACCPLWGVYLNQGTESDQCLNLHSRFEYSIVDFSGLHSPQDEPAWRGQGTKA